MAKTAYYERAFLCEEPESVELSINGKTDKCSSGEDINFQFTGFGITGKVCVEF